MIGNVLVVTARIVVVVASSVAPDGRMVVVWVGLVSYHLRLGRVVRSP